jgi:hypothetical protein
MASLLSVLALLITIQATAAAQDLGREDPMARFAPMVGDWHVRHTLWPANGAPPEVFEGTARMYFVEGGKVFVVDEVTPDNRYRFVGYHSFDAATGKYVNWTASSTLVLAWGEGEWNDSGETFRTRRLDPRTGQIDPLIGRGVWTIVNIDLNVFNAVRLDVNGAEVPFKEERYSRIKR